MNLKDSLIFQINISISISICKNMDELKVNTENGIKNSEVKKTEICEICFKF